MSSSYSRICLSHGPPLILDEDYPPTTWEPSRPVQPDEHPHCVIGVGRWSGALISLWLPTPYTDKDGPHPGQWYDVSWIHNRSLHGVLDLLSVSYN